MGKKKKNAGGRHGLQVVTLCISTTMVLVLLGMVVFTILTAHSLSTYFKENLTLSVWLRDNVTQQERTATFNQLRKCPYVHQITYISKEQAQKENYAEMGMSESEEEAFLDGNPYPESFEIRLKADYANSDSVLLIKEQLLANPKVSEVFYQENLMDQMNANLCKISLVLLVLAVLLTVVSFSLISNSVRLSIYARRFIIHTMKLVGASWSFIRWPFLKRAVGVGIVAALLANILLGAGIYALYIVDARIMDIITWVELTITGVSVLLFGIIITALCAYLAVNKFLRMSAGELYKI
ncbi:MAG: permease-like cell division protein FtsX [Prevotella sp.]|nr:permease-like cell division protein FtsX [Prevotella sp.]